jgi:hypothetical protein
MWHKGVVQAFFYGKSGKLNKESLYLRVVFN